MQKNFQLTMEQKGSSELLKEVFFLITKFLSDSPCQETFEVLKRELDEKHLLPCKYDVNGDKQNQTYDDLLKKYPHIQPDTLLKVCLQLRNILSNELPSGMCGVKSILGTGRFSILRSNNKVPAYPITRIYARHHGCLLQGSIQASTHRNLVRILESRRTSGNVSRKHVIWPKLYSRLQLHKQTLGHLSAVYCALFDQTGQYIFTGADDCLVKVWRTASGRLLATFRGPTCEITDLAVNQENTLLAAGSLDRILYVWCLQSTTLVARLAAPTGMITGVNFCPKACGDFRYLASTSTDGSVTFWVYNHHTNGQETVFWGKPVLFNEKMRPGVAQMICSAFSPGGTFLAAGSADHHVRVYLIPGDEGPQRIMEEEAHSDRVDSIQWANRHLRFVSGSKDGTVLVWRFRRQRWTNLRLDVSAELLGQEVSNVSQEQQRQKPRVYMICWDRTDRLIITAIHDASIKIWDSETGELKKVFRKHRRDVFVLETHPHDADIMLSAGHDGQLCVWDIVSGTCVYQYQNLIDTQGHGSFYDAKWSPDGTIIAATDSHGHILLFGFGAANQLLKQLPRELFFSTDFWPVAWDDERGGIVDENTNTLTHMMPRPFLAKSDGSLYPPEFQHWVPGREFDDLSSSTVLPAHPSSSSWDEEVTHLNAWAHKNMLPPLPSGTINTICDRIDAIGNEERLEYETESKQAPESPKLPVEQNIKPKKKRPRQTAIYKTRATAEESDFVNPDTIDMTPSSDSSSFSDQSADSDSSSSSSEYSDWIADQGVSLEPPKRARRRRPPRRLSPAEEVTSRRRKAGTKEEGKIDDKNSPTTSSPSKPSVRLQDLPKEFLPPKWLSEVVPRKAPYYPQMGDEDVFFQEGYKLYLDAVRDKQVYKPSTRDSFSRFGLEDPICVRIIGIKYEIRPPRLCCLRLAVLRPNGTMTNQFFNIKYHDVPDVIDFLVLKQTYEIAMKRKWKPGDRFRCMIDDAWWLGSIVAAERKNEHSPNSPFLSLLTKWDNGEDERISPWDLEPVDPHRLPAEPGGSIDVLPEETLNLLYIPREDEWPGGDRDGTCDRIVAGFEKVMTISIAEAFSAPVDLNLYPLYAMAVEYPVDLSTIKARLENRFYRRLTAVQYDVRYLATNAEKFNDVHSQIVKHARIVTDLCLSIIKDQKEDVLATYHQLVDGYQSSSDDEEEEKEGSDDGADTWRGDCERLLRELSSHPDSLPFREPVDLKEFPDYLQVVDTPMDLGTVREELMAGNYHNPKEFYEAVRLIFTNSKSYNTNKRSRISSMSVRLSNLFEARLKQLMVEWKASRRKRIRQSVRTRKQRLEAKDNEPSTSKQFNAHNEPSEVLAMQVHEPKPSTSTSSSSSSSVACNRRLEPLRITILRKRPSLSSQSRNSSSSDEDTNLSILRNSFLNKSGSDQTMSSSSLRTYNGELNHPSIQKLKIKNISRLANGNLRVNGNILEDERSMSSDGDQVLATLRNDSKQPTEVNGHSYAKTFPSTSHSIPTIQSEGSDGDEGTLKVSKGSETESSSSKTQRKRRVCSESSESENDVDGSDMEWNKDGAEDESESDESKTKGIKLPVRKSLRAGARTTRRLRTRHSKDSAEENDSSEESDLQKVASSESIDSNESSDQPKRNRRKKEESTDEDIGSRRLRKRKKKSSSESDSSTWWPSDNERKKKRRSQRPRRRRFVNEDSNQQLRTSVSSRGRVRRLTERARAAFKRRE